MIAQKKIPQNRNQTEHKYLIILIENLGSKQTNTSLNLINHQCGTIKIYLYTSDPYKAIYKV